jgi:hypothetical protein
MPFLCLSRISAITAIDDWSRIRSLNAPHNSRYVVFASVRLPAPPLHSRIFCKQFSLFWPQYNYFWQYISYPFYLTLPKNKNKFLFYFLFLCVATLGTGRA